ncbi:uncharacterized protein LOC105703379 [Orussus abietinus]|uniref:uncharacterized protein LOC105703379 n=1 Tax=Orussus abietinus TaxID=222816 RepID=UPI000625650A|nr:uncharacterized protein LOC105703379 [Orussus abietinus]XP_012287165.1 uncharacterized protein LOC105703379 [Orussus abietinus]XP_012287166.1 uncharacterized protein LOC105703379 [Orussus abietinus]
MDCPKLICDLRIPKIMWYQTDVTVVIRVMLCDVTDYYLCIKDDHFQFSTIVDNNKYYIGFNLFGTVIEEETTHENLGREIKITLYKAHKWIPWLKLHADDCKYPQILLDPERLYQPVWVTAKKNVEVREDFAKYKRRHKITQIMPDVPSTDEEESDDELFDMFFE